MDKTKYIVMVVNDDSGYTHDYDLVVKETQKGRKMTLFYSNNNNWVDSVRGEKIMSLLDTGDGVIVKGAGKSMDYGQLFELRLLMNFNNKTNSSKLDKIPSKIIKKGQKIIKL